jgi:hypothetical protein
VPARPWSPGWATSTEAEAAATAFDDLTGPWPDLPPIDIAVPGTGPSGPAVPAHGPFDRERVARLDAEQLGVPLDRAR